jgi:hypothetical protein
MVGWRRSRPRGCPSIGSGEPPATSLPGRLYWLPATESNGDLQMVSLESNRIFLQYPSENPPISQTFTWAPERSVDEACFAVTYGSFRASDRTVSLRRSDNSHKHQSTA